MSDAFTHLIACIQEKKKLMLQYYNVQFQVEIETEKRERKKEVETDRESNGGTGEICWRKDHFSTRS